MADLYTPGLGQMMFGQPTGEFALPDFVESMFEGLMYHCRRVHCNVLQREWEDYDDADLGGVHLRHYSWGDEDAGPNFWVDSDPQRLRWYKHPGRGMSAEVEYTTEQWIAWHDKVLAELHRVDEGRREINMDTTYAE